MKKTKTTVCFHGTEEQRAKLETIIAELKDTPGAIMPILQKAQDVYGYLPIETAMLNYLDLLTYKYDQNAEIVRERGSHGIHTIEL